MAEGANAAVLAEVRRLFLERLSQTVQSAGLTAPRALDALCRSSGQFFDEMTSSSGRAGFEQAAGLTASKIMLVDDAELEVSIRLGDLSRRLFEECAVVLAKLHPRLVTLLGRSEMDSGENPLGPEAIRAGLTELLGAMEWSPEQAESWLGDIESRLVRDLPLLYVEINELLVHRNVAATRAQTGAGGDWGGGAVSRPGLQVGSRAADPLAALQQAMFAQGQPAAGTAGFGSGGGLGMPPVAGGGAAPAAAALSAVLREELLSRLGEKQEQQTLDLFAGDEPNADASCLRRLKGEEIGSLLGGRDAASLDILALLFDAMFDDPRLPDAIKASMARLQIPLLKAAILDASFFSDRGHPGRQLLDGMALAATGLAPDADGGHPVCAELHRIAVAVQAEFSRDTEVLAQHAAELETFVARRNHDIQAAAERFIPLTERQEAQDLAVLRARAAIRAKLADQKAPAVVADFLRQDWQRVLELAWLDGGDQGDAFLAECGVVDDLLWSVTAKSDVEERKRVATVVPGLLRRLREGLDRVGVTSQARAPFFDACFALQTAVLRGKELGADFGQTAQVEAALTGGADSPTTGEATVLAVLELDGRKLTSVRPADAIAASAGRLVAGLQIGDWIEFPLAGGTRCGRLVWVGKALGQPLFMNPEWDGAVSVAPQVLEGQLASGQAVVLSGRSIFDEAAAKALKAIAPSSQRS